MEFHRLHLSDRPAHQERHHEIKSYERMVQETMILVAFILVIYFAIKNKSWGLLLFGLAFHMLWTGALETIRPAHYNMIGCVFILLAVLYYYSGYNYPNDMIVKMSLLFVVFWILTPTYRHHHHKKEKEIDD